MLKQGRFVSEIYFYEKCSMQLFLQYVYGFLQTPFRGMGLSQKSLLQNGCVWNYAKCSLLNVIAKNISYLTKSRTNLNSDYAAFSCGFQWAESHVSLGEWNNTNALYACSDTWVLINLKLSSKVEQYSCVRTCIEYCK